MVISRRLVLSAVGLLAFSTSTLLVFGNAQAQQRISLRNAPRSIREAAVQTLQGLGIQPNNEMMFGITTDDCPSNCNNKVAGGKCLCEKGSDGNCPEGTEKVPTEDTGNCCRTDPETGQVSGGGLSAPVEVQMP